MSSSAVAYHATEAGANPSDAGYSNNSGSYYHPNEGHPPMLPSSYSYSSHQSNQRPPMMHQQPHYPPPSDGYSTAQYNMPYHQTTTGYQYAQPPTSAPMPPPPQQQSRYHHHPPPPQSAQPPMYYGSWPGASTPTPSMNQQQYQHQVHYGQPSYNEILPPENATRHGNLIRPSSSGKDINVFDMPSEELETALFHVKRNPKATLFDVEGKQGHLYTHSLAWYTNLYHFDPPHSYYIISISHILSIYLMDTQTFVFRHDPRHCLLRRGWVKIHP